MPLRLVERIKFYNRVLHYRWWWDKGEIAFIRSLLRKGETAIDIGAYKGGYTYWMHRSVGPTGHVFSFEPQAKVAAYLRHMATLLKMSPVTVENIAISSTIGSATFTIPTGEGSASPGATLEKIAVAGAKNTTQVSVPTETLDHYLELRQHALPVRFIKVDVEGHELDVFRGAEATLRRDKPALLFECEQRHHGGKPIAPVFNHLESLGYRGSFFLHGKLLPLDRFDPTKHQVEGKEPYVNNFVFQAK